MMLHISPNNESVIYTLTDSCKRCQYAFSSPWMVYVIPPASHIKSMNKAATGSVKLPIATLFCMRLSLYIINRLLYQNGNTSFQNGFFPPP